MNPHNTRIRCQSGQIDQPGHKDDKKWVTEVSLWDFTGETQFGVLGTYGPFETHDQAVAHGKKVCKIAADTIEEKIMGRTSGKYLDMKNGGVMRSWNEN